MTISYLVPTIGRPSLAHTLASIECRDGDEILVLGETDVPMPHAQVRHIPMIRSGNIGNTERNVGLALSRGDYIAYLDDDDAYAPGHREIMAQAIASAPDRPIMFKMRYPDGHTLWRDHALAVGNIGTPMILLPRETARRGHWPWLVYCGEVPYLESCGWTAPDFVWREEVVGLVRPQVAG